VSTPLAHLASTPLTGDLQAAGLERWTPGVPTAVDAALAPCRHGDLPRWQALLEGFPELPEATIDLTGDAVRVGERETLDAATRDRLETALLALRPWRKGPFSLYGIDVDAEWRSDLKWRRVKSAHIDFRGARVLDVGCGNGYYAWRMLGEGARAVIGVDPTLVHVMQAAAVRHCMPRSARTPLVLPLPLEVLPPGAGEFDAVFSMGVLYHRRSPLDHLLALREHLKPGGTLLMESLVVPGDVDTCLCPPGRYARMRNLYFLPSTLLLVRWLERCGFTAQVIDETPTTPAEQRSTPFMPFESLEVALDPTDPTRTVEGHPGPLRALIKAHRRDA